MDDLIRRQDAIDIVAKEYQYESDRITALQKIPAVELPTWIPCSERLPEEFSYILVCTDENEIFLATYLGTLNDGSHCFDDDDGMMCEGDVIAWQPLPEPYKGETENDES